jgi:phosphoribosylanthranilate isomerase
MTKIKICGITNLEDALTAAAAGADYLGFIFYPPSPRAITPETATAVAAQLRAGEKCPILVGVFVNETAERMAAILDQCQLDLAQLSGEEVPSLIGDPQSPLYGRAYKALRPTSFTEAEAEAEWYLPPDNPRPLSPPPGDGLLPGDRFRQDFDPARSSVQAAAVPRLLIDTHHPTLRGGTGQTGDWQMIAQLAETIPGLMLAGGLTPDNVAEAVAQVRPFAVDTASGVESGPGKKDGEKVRRFVTAVRRSSADFAD